MKKRLLLVILIAIILSSCGQAKKTHTYADLSDDQKATIDFIMSKSDEWETEQCDKVWFTTYQGEPVVSVFNLEHNYGSEFSGKWISYSYDLAADEFYSVYQRDEYGTYYNSSGWGVGKKEERPTHKKEWSVSWSEEQKKDYLANNLWSDKGAN